MILTRGQEAGLAMAKRLKESKKGRVAILGGFAGTGKTTLLKTIAEEIGTPVVITPTGKAAARVKEASGLGAMTAHRWMYRPREDVNTGNVDYERLDPQQLSKGECGVLVIEEASMISRDLWEDIYDNALILDLKILCIGDPFQLPPVEDQSTGFSLLDPNAGIASEYVLMTEVLRQAQESPVIRASMEIRAGNHMAALSMLPQVRSRDFVEAGARVQARGGVVICYRNDTRHWANEGIRELRRLPPGDVLSDEPILVLKNNYKLNVFNGETHRFSSWFERPMGKHHVYDRWKKLREETTLGVGTFRTDDGQEFTGVVLFEELFGRLKVGFSAMDNTADIVHPGLPVVHANFGYTMTAHKAQGSEWNEVLVAWEPSLRFWGDFRDSSLRWLYTAVTRARERCSICFGVAGPKVTP